MSLYSVVEAGFQTLPDVPQGIRLSLSEIIPVLVNLISFSWGRGQIKEWKFIHPILNLVQLKTKDITQKHGNQDTILFLRKIILDAQVRKFSGRLWVMINCGTHTCNSALQSWKQEETFKAILALSDHLEKEKAKSTSEKAIVSFRMGRQELYKCQVLPLCMDIQ